MQAVGVCVAEGGEELKHDVTVGLDHCGMGTQLRQGLTQT